MSNTGSDHLPSASAESSAGFTPGPWRVECEFPYIEVHDCYGRTATVYGERTDAETQATARLIAAAPDLLEALQLVVDKLGTDYELYREQQFAIDTARAAIAKAVQS